MLDSDWTGCDSSQTQVCGRANSQLLEAPTLSFSDNSDMEPAEIKDNPAPVTVGLSSTSTADAIPPAPRRDGPTEMVHDLGDIEEDRAAYRPGGFHPVYIGDVYAHRYKILNKIGYGVYSTVWLVEDLTKP